MSAEILKGGAEGSDRAAILTKAREVAAVYFGTKCVDVRLRDAGAERLDMENGAVTGVFHANFDAQEDHALETPTYGFPKCRGCGKTTSLSSLPRAEWPEGQVER